MEKRKHGATTALSSAMRQSRHAIVGVAVFSFFINGLMLTVPLYMLQIYDRVLPSRSVPTLLALAGLAAGLFLAQGFLDTIRARVLARIGETIDSGLSGRVHEVIVRMQLKSARRGDGLQPLRDLDTMRNFLSGQGPTALFDLPWMPVYLAIIFAFHYTLGLTALFGAIILFAGNIPGQTRTLTLAIFDAFESDPDVAFGLAALLLLVSAALLLLGRFLLREKTP